MRKKVLITGASSGIGAAFAQIAANSGNDIVLVARRRDKLESLATRLSKEYSIKAEVIVSDLNLPGEPEKIWSEATNLFGSIDVLINNAGFGDFGELTKTDSDKNQSMIHLNCTVLTELARLASVTMSEQGQGYICNVASIAGFSPGPYMAAYYATKAYVLSFSQAIGEELRSKNISVSALCPGATRTEFEDHAKMTGKGIFDSKRKLPEALEVAQVGWDAMLAGRPVAIFGLKNRLGISLMRFLPLKLKTRVAAKVQQQAL
jgi:short-subunit dehydrogenase